VPGRRTKAQKAKKNLSRAASAAKYLAAAKAAISFLEDRLPTPKAKRRKERRSLKKPALIAGVLGVAGAAVAKRKRSGSDFDVAGATPTAVPTPAPAPAPPTGDEAARTGGGQGSDTAEETKATDLVEAAETGGADGHGA
jgi:hypothetical protein